MTRYSVYGCMQDEEDKIETDRRYMKQHGRPEWADVMHITPEDYEAMKAEDPVFACDGPGAGIVEYFKAAHAQQSQGSTVPPTSKG